MVKRSFYAMICIFFFQITKDGLLGFSRSTGYKPVDYSAPNLSPFLRDPFIAPYYYEGEGLEILQNYTGSVSYQQYNLTSSNRRNSAKLSVTWLGQYVRSQIVGSDHFYPDWALQVTWTDVTSVQEIAQGSCDGTRSNPCAVRNLSFNLYSRAIIIFCVTGTKSNASFVHE